MQKSSPEMLCPVLFSMSKRKKKEKQNKRGPETHIKNNERHREKMLYEERLVGLGFII